MKKNILITGGSSGIGEGLARYFHSKGWQVLITGRNMERLAALKNELPQLNTIRYDSLKQGQEQEIVDFIRKEWDSKLDVLVNNAGHVALTPLEGVDEESLEEMYRVHLIAPTMLTAGCLGFLEKTKGQIVNVSSSHGIKAFPQLSAYGSAKAGLNMLTKIWALELAPLGIRVNSIAPGPTDTPVLAHAGLSEEIIAAIHREEVELVPLRRRGSVEDMVANAALLIDSGSTWVTGVVLPIDGGVSVN
ncbi:SDR family NAD(P)-dependent oxidoreductase [Olivibacter domesticus]|uniref:NAD(P)-dependent dehydrogenase, short-chain alcohol dehydrogenase family n=1 Tax=Olivibacter domesticus TaxID=407022 RepID=A0A1H7ZBT4_OLID1|nr:SDR family oxidoreductase [Olivibacter domesticus]SEM55691.1 NAD(P)-dependent dehydrogenase, short-chain alcohol dehydrogenase family [Olivibacter domesticus]